MRYRILGIRGLVRWQILAQLHERFVSQEVSKKTRKVRRAECEARIFEPHVSEFEHTFQRRNKYISGRVSCIQKVMLNHINPSTLALATHVRQSSWVTYLRLKADSC